MHLFYTPDIVPPVHTLPEEESRHCVRVLRLGAGDRLHLTDGRGTLYVAEIVDAGQKRCTVRVVETREEWGRRPYRLTMAVAPTKNIDRYEWFLEKATEIGCDTFVPIECDHSERRIIKPEREVKVITSAMKQSLKAYHPVLEPMTSVKEVIRRPFAGVKMIAHCDPAAPRRFIGDVLSAGDDALVLIGPEGDFSPDEVALAREHGFTEISLGDSRLRTETAAITTTAEIAILNR